MIKAAIKRISIPIALLSFAVSAWATSFPSKEGNPPNEITARDEQQPQKSKPPSELRIERAFVVNISNADESKPKATKDQTEKPINGRPDWLLYFTGIAAAAAAVQGFALMITIIVMVRTARRQLRAYITMTPKNVMNWAHGTNREGIEVELENRGQTPGFGLYYDFSMAILSAPPRNPRITDRRYSQDNALYPTETLPMRLFYERNLTPAEILAVESGPARFYVWGIMHYRDIFKRHRKTVFSFSFGGRDFASFMRGVPGAAWSWDHGKYHNEPEHGVRPHSGVGWHFKRARRE